jgi:TPR repeat protein
MILGSLLLLLPAVVTQDKEKAKELWRKAAAQGNQDAKDNLKKYFNE